MKKYILALLISVLMLHTPTLWAEEDIKSTDNDKDIYQMLELFGDIFQKVREEYVEEPKAVELVESAINGMLTDLDPHSSYLNRKDFKEMQIQTKGEFGGLGIEVTMRQGMVYVVSPIDDTPADKAGILAGDYISHIDGEPVQGMILGDAVKKMRGKPQTDITLTILRKGETAPMDVKVTRDVITIKAVTSRVEGDVGYVRISGFSEQTDAGLEDALDKIKEEGADALKGVVLDLRNNPGGLLNQAIAVADIFLDQGEIVSTRGRDPKSTTRFSATEGDEIDGLPVVVLINGGSASASEIVAGALQDHKRALVMGTQSFGKGSVQTVIPLPNDSAIRLTTSRYYTPSGKSIQAKGITPDITVSRAEVKLLDTDYKTTEASLHGHLGSGQEDDDSEDNTAPKENNEDTVKKILNGDEEEEKSLYETDYQLARAIDMVKGLYLVWSKSASTMK